MPAAPWAKDSRLPICSTSLSCPVDSLVWGSRRTTATPLRALPLGSISAVRIILGSCATRRTLGTSARPTIVVASQFESDFPITPRISPAMGTALLGHSATTTFIPTFSSMLRVASKWPVAFPLSCTGSTSTTRSSVSTTGALNTCSSANSTSPRLPPVSAGPRFMKNNKSGVAVAEHSLHICHGYRPKSQDLPEFLLQTRASDGRREVYHFG